MQTSSNNGHRLRATSPSFLPDFCANRNVFLIVVIAELLAIILALSSNHVLQDFWLELAGLSFLVQWIALGSAATLCAFSRWINRLNALWATLTAYGLIQLVTLLISLLTLWYFEFHGLWSSSGPSTGFIFRNLAISSIVSLAALRYFYVQHQWRTQIRAESQARLQALQARIRPHFLFNSMNTIASLIRNRPEQAEEAVMDLADLFRSSLRQQDRIRLREELELTRRYLNIEGLRLGERLQVDWRLADNLPLDMEIPPLILQPLVENAIYHGIQPLTEGGCVTIEIVYRNNRLWFHIGNPLPFAAASSQRSNRVAQENIRQRLALAYGEESVFSIHMNEDRYNVSFTIPVES